MSSCCCSLVGTKDCWTCPNSMSGVGDRYPAPYAGKTWVSDRTVYGPIKYPETLLPSIEEILKQTQELLTKVDEAHEAAGRSALHFGQKYLLVGSADEELAAEEGVVGV